MDYIILLFSCIAEYLIFSDFFDAFLTIRPNFQPIRNRILIAIPFIGIYFGINTLQLSYLNMIAFICLILLYSFLYEASLKERLRIFICSFIESACIPFSFQQCCESVHNSLADIYTEAPDLSDLLPV